jgi:hypothetical protein
MNLGANSASRVADRRSFRRYPEVDLADGPKTSYLSVSAVKPSQYGLCKAPGTL